tara:strand:- start:1609 stop:2472 length:864 start_codon:yes stop_codon:yes gene_type:complete
MHEFKCNVIATGIEAKEKARFEKYVRRQADVLLQPGYQFLAQLEGFPTDIPPRQPQSGVDDMLLKQNTIIQELQRIPGLIGLWIPNKGGGDTLNDLSGRNTHGDLSGPSWVSENGIWVLSYDGTDDYVQVDTFPNLGIQDITYIFWLNHAGAAGERAFFSRNWRYFAINANKASILWTFTGDDGRWDSPAMVTTNAWFHIAMTYNPTSTLNNPAMWINGDSITLTETATPTGATDDYSAAPINFGRRDGGDDLHFQGKMGDIAIFNRPLTNAEIRNYYEQTRVLYKI